MEIFYKGKTKDVYKLANGNYVLRFKDTVTGWADSGERDSGGNQVVGEVAGVGYNCLKVSKYYFELLNKNKIPTHFISANLDKVEMEVLPCQVFGFGLEWVIRYKATGSFTKRFGAFVEEGDDLPEVFEVTLKDDDRDDPPITEEILVALKKITAKEFKQLADLTRKSAQIVKADLAKKGAQLWDIKFEFGRDAKGKFVVIDEVSGGNMRVYKNGEKLSYEQVAALF
ncbi:MAG: phosphoribosylaminoimidazolesuccinocarboxamide synthase [Firmicutes bacterium]|nr:phosphoribosylaminoimidazolesuccinocarboxamide synthase [Bacillota bacterium]